MRLFYDIELFLRHNALFILPIFVLLIILLIIILKNLQSTRDDHPDYEIGAYKNYSSEENKHIRVHEVDDSDEDHKQFRNKSKNPDGNDEIFKRLKDMKLEKYYEHKNTSEKIDEMKNYNIQQVSSIILLIVFIIEILSLFTRFTNLDALTPIVRFFFAKNIISYLLIFYGIINRRIFSTIGFAFMVFFGPQILSFVYNFTDFSYSTGFDIFFKGFFVLRVLLLSQIIPNLFTKLYFIMSILLLALSYTRGMYLPETLYIFRDVFFVAGIGFELSKTKKFLKKAYR